MNYLQRINLHIEFISSLSLRIWPLPLCVASHNQRLISLPLTFHYTLPLLYIYTPPCDVLRVKGKGGGCEPVAVGVAKGGWMIIYGHDCTLRVQNAAENALGVIVKPSHRFQARTRGNDSFVGNWAPLHHHHHYHHHHYHHHHHHHQSTHSLTINILITV